MLKPDKMAMLVKNCLLDEDWPPGQSPPRFGHRGGLGLFVYRASASFRRVQVVPRP